MTAMSSFNTYKMDGNVEVDETYVGGKEKLRRGRSKGAKKLVAVGIQKKGKGISRAYLREIKDAGVKQLQPFFLDHISKDAKITTDGWRSIMVKTSIACIDL